MSQLLPRVEVANMVPTRPGRSQNWWKRYLCHIESLREAEPSSWATATKLHFKSTPGQEMITDIQ